MVTYRTPSRVARRNGGRIMNLKLRLKNKATLTAIIAAVITCVYSIAVALGIELSVGQEQVAGIVGVILTILTGLGILVDPTTKGIEDSDRAKNYTEPK